MASSNFTLTPASQAFVDMRATSLGPWVLGGFVDSILMGIIFCQMYNYFVFRRTEYGMSRYYTYLVLFVTFLSTLKTAQAISVVYVQNVLAYANPDRAATLANDGWWQISVPFMTGIIGSVVQSFFAFRFYRLSNNWIVAFGLIYPAIILGLASVTISMYNIKINHAKAKVLWLLVHFVSVFIADVLITLGTTYTLRKRSTGLAVTSSLINRLLRMVFESAIPPTVIATIDLILTQTLGPQLLWHLLVNYSLSKVYVISLLYTLNSISEHRKDNSSRSREGYSNRVTRHGDVELAPRGEANIYIQTQTTTHISPKSPIAIRTLRTGDDAVEKSNYAF
ncbi:hypothetical protein C8F01DRAFT_76577 [Mycena amicta]|nr:hypothetical protein C8F01DRAFT_76577 [Mycena amicta]